MGVKEVGFWQQKAKKLEMDLFEKDKELDKQMKIQLAMKANYDRMSRERAGSLSGNAHQGTNSRTRTASLGGTSSQEKIESVVEKPRIRIFPCAPNPGANKNAEDNGDMTAEQEEFMMQMTDSIIQKLRAENEKKDATIHKLTGQLAQSRGYPLLSVMKDMPEEQETWSRRNYHHGHGKYANTIENLLQSYYDEKDYEEPFDYDKFLQEDFDDISRNSEEMREFDTLKNSKVDEYDNLRKNISLLRTTRDEYKSTSTLPTPGHHSHRHPRDNPNHIDNKPRVRPMS